MRRKPVTSDEIEFKTKAEIRDKGGYHIMINGSVQEEDIIVNICIPFSSVTQSCLTLCNPMNRSTPYIPVHHQLPELTQTYVH